MKRLFVIAAALVVPGMAAPAVAQTFGPNDAFIDQIGDSTTTAASPSGSLATSKAADIEQIGGRAAEVAPSGPGKPDISTRAQAAHTAADVIHLGPNHTKASDRHGVSGNNASPTELGEGHSARWSPKSAKAVPRAPSSPGRAQAAGGGAGAGTSPRSSVR
jgi:hypothetical protein